MNIVPPKLFKNVYSVQLFHTINEPLTKKETAHCWPGLKGFTSAPGTNGLEVSSTDKVGKLDNIEKWANVFLVDTKKNKRK